MNKQLQKLIEKQRKIEEQIAEAKRREAFARRFTEIARKAGALEIDDENFWKEVFAQAISSRTGKAEG